MSDNSDYEDYTKEKQNYLRSKIIDVGYDPVHFTDFMSKQKEDGEDIDNWSISSLKDMVVKYINATGAPTANIDSESETEESIEYKDSSDEDFDPLSEEPTPIKQAKIEVESEGVIESECIEEELDVHNEEKQEESEIHNVEKVDESDSPIHMTEEPDIEGDIGGFKNIPEEKPASKPKQGPEKPQASQQDSTKSKKTKNFLTDAVKKLLEEYQENKSQVNNFTGRAKTQEIRMPTELTNARNLTCKISE